MRIIFRLFERLRVLPFSLVIGTAIILGMIALASIGVSKLPPLPDSYNFSARLQPPGGEYILGTDDLGRNVMHRLIRGIGISLRIAFIPVSIATLAGVILGSLAAWRMGVLDTIVLSIMDIIQSIPAYFLILTVLAALEQSGRNVMIAIGLSTWPVITRLIRAEILTLKRRPFVEAARGLGASDLRILFRHILPHTTAPMLVAFALGMSTALLTESALSYLGLGVEPETPSLGNVLASGRNMYGHWWLSVFPGMMIFAAILGFNMISEGLRDHLDPKAGALRTRFSGRVSGRFGKKRIKQKYSGNINEI